MISREVPFASKSKKIKTFSTGEVNPIPGGREKTSYQVKRHCKVVCSTKLCKKICNPSLLSKNYFVLSNLLAKMSLYVSFFITTNKNWNLEGSYAFHKKLPRRSKIWKKNLFWILWAASSSYELPAIPPFPHMLQLMPRFLLLPQQKLFVICNF